jgi:hypothetical protein
MARRTVGGLFAALWANDDAASYAVGREVLSGQHSWLEAGGMGLGLTIEDLRPSRLEPALPPQQRPRAVEPVGAA